MNVDDTVGVFLVEVEPTDCGFKLIHEIDEIIIF